MTPTEPTEPSDPTEPTEPTESTEPTEPTVSADATESTEASPATEPAGTSAAHPPRRDVRGVIVLVVAVGAVLALLVAGVVAVTGDDGSTGSTDTVAAQEWAGGVCSAFDEWVQDVRDTVAGLPGAGSLDDASEELADGIDAATSQLRDRLDALGTPDTEKGRRARAEVQRLSATVRRGFDRISRQIDRLQGASGRQVVRGLARIAGELSVTLDDARASIEQLQGLDASGELRAAFEDAPECRALARSSD